MPSTEQHRGVKLARQARQAAVYFFFFSTSLLLLLVAMTCNQVQSFQINDYANHYVDIEITGYRALYSKSITGRGVARLISWLGTAGPVDWFNK